MTTHQPTRISCHLVILSDKLAGQHVSALVRERNVSAFSIQLCRRAAARVRGRSLLIKRKTNHVSVLEVASRGFERAQRLDDGTARRAAGASLSEMDLYSSASKEYR